MPNKILTCLLLHCFCPIIFPTTSLSHYVIYYFPIPLSYLLFPYPIILSTISLYPIMLPTSYFLYPIILSISYFIPFCFHYFLYYTMLTLFLTRRTDYARQFIFWSDFSFCTTNAACLIYFDIIHANPLYCHGQETTLPAMHWLHSLSLNAIGI